MNRDSVLTFKKYLKKILKSNTFWLVVGPLVGVFLGSLISVAGVYWANSFQEKKDRKNKIEAIYSDITYNIYQYANAKRNYYQSILIHKFSFAHSFKKSTPDIIFHEERETINKNIKLIDDYSAKVVAGYRMIKIYNGSQKLDNLQEYILNYGVQFIDTIDRIPPDSLLLYEPNLVQNGLFAEMTSNFTPHIITFLDSLVLITPELQNERE